MPVVHLIDSHCHLDFEVFDNDRSEVLQRAKDNNISDIVIPGTEKIFWDRIKQLCENQPHLHACYGLHPYWVNNKNTQDIHALDTYIESNCPVALGECGLDFNRNFSTRENQLRAFEAQLELAAQLGMPAFLHQRDAHHDFVAILKNAGAQLKNVVAHCFTGTAAEVNDYLELGLSIGVTGWICDERRGTDLQQAVKEIPLDRIMLETDAPYLLPRDLLGKPVKKSRNEPCFLPHIARSVAKQMKLDEPQLISVANKNSRAFFKLN